MAKKGRGSRKKGSRRRNSSLREHQQHRKTLTPPLLTLPDLTMTSWPHTGLPECLWIAAVAKETGHRFAAHVPLEILDAFAPDAEIVDGRISRFALIPEDRREEARKALRAGAVKSLPDDLGHALALYPECPALWLYEDLLASAEVDEARGIAYLKDLVAPMIPSRDRLSAELRLVVIGRLAKAGRLNLREDLEIVELLSKYPTYLDADGRAKVEGFARSTWNMLSQMPSGRPEDADEWSRYFWRQSWRSSDCDPPPAQSPPVEEADDPAPQSAEESSRRRADPSYVSQVRDGFLRALSTLGSGLRELQRCAAIDTFSPEEHEVKLGLASRAFRLAYLFVSDPNLWTNQLAPHIVRSMVDERIVVAWLLKQDDPKLFETYKEYGRGKQKLFKLKLEEVMDRDGLEDEDLQGLHKSLEAEVNQDSMEEFLKIDVGGSFSGKNIRQMAIETDLADLYSLSYQPLSSESHGDWSSLVNLDLTHCGNPLHRYHRLGSFEPSEGNYIHIGWVQSAFGLAETTITEIFDSLDLDVEPLFDECHAAMEESAQRGRTGERQHARG